MVTTRVVVVLSGLAAGGFAIVVAGAATSGERAYAAILGAVFVALHVAWTWRATRDAPTPPWAGRALLLASAALLLIAPSLVGAAAAPWRLGLATVAAAPLLARADASPREAWVTLALVSGCAAVGAALAGAGSWAALETLLGLAGVGALAFVSAGRGSARADGEDRDGEDPSDSVVAARRIASAPPERTTSPAGRNASPPTGSLAEQLQAARAELEAARAINRNKSSFLANMTHDLRTPLNSIIGYAEMLVEDETGLSEEAAADLATIRNAARGMLEIINDVVDISKIEAGRMTINYQQFEVTPFLASLKAAVAPLGRRLGVPFELRCSPLVGRLKTDRVKLNRILQNLLSNAFKFTTKGSVTLQVDLLSIESTPWLSFAVIDTGVGVPKDKLGALFDAFVQVDESTNDEHAGAGLGLALVKHYADALGGNVLVESEVGVGSTFTLLLPRSPADAASSGAMMISVH